MVNPHPVSAIPPVKAREEKSSVWTVVVVLLLLTIFRFWYAATHQLVQDESYYWQWSRHLAWGYYDNTPLLALVIRATTTLFGSHEVGVRTAPILCAFVASWYLYRLADRLLGPRIALFAVILANIIPLFATGAIIATQDPVQLALWAAALYVAHLAITEKPGWWYLAGLLMGLAALAKLNALLLLPSLLLYLMLSRTHRHWLKRPEPYLAAVIALAVFSPFIWWNHTHQNAFWLHIHSMGSRSSGHDSLKHFGDFVGAQALLLSPLVFLVYLYTLYDGGRRGAKEHDDAMLYLWCPSIVVFAATTYVSFRSKVEGNWAVAAYITGLILVAAVLARAWQRGVGGRIWTGFNVGLAAVLALAVLFPGLLYGAGVKFPDPTKDRTNELYGWREMAARIAQEQAAMQSTDGKPPFIFGVNYRMPSESAFYLPGQPETYSLFLNDRANEYMFWEDPQALVGQDAVFVNDTDTPDHLDDVRAVFTRVEVQPALKIYRDPPYGQKPIRTIQLFRCYGFKGYSVKQWQVGW